jgi:membrane-associated phospholipid phosphatase
MEKSIDRAFPLIFSSISYYLGYLMLRQIPLFPIYQLFLVSSILVQTALLVITLRWKISAHTAAIGGLTGGFLALSFRYHENSGVSIALLFFIAGMVATSRLILEKHNSAQVYCGFLLGFLIMSLIILSI